VYLQLSGGQQPVLDLSLASAAAARDQAGGAILVRPAPLPVVLDENEIAAHKAFIDGLGGEVLWRQYDE